MFSGGGLDYTMKWNPNLKLCQQIFRNNIHLCKRSYTGVYNSRCENSTSFLFHSIKMIKPVIIFTEPLYLKYLHGLSSDTRMFSWAIISATSKCTRLGALQPMSLQAGILTIILIILPSWVSRLCMLCFIHKEWPVILDILMYMWLTTGGGGFCLLL